MLSTYTRKYYTRDYTTRTRTLATCTKLGSNARHWSLLSYSRDAYHWWESVSTGKCCNCSPAVAKNVLILQKLRTVNFCSFDNFDKCFALLSFAPRIYLSESAELDLNPRTLVQTLQFFEQLVLFMFFKITDYLKSTGSK